MYKTTRYCLWLEIFSRHFTGRLPGEPPLTLLDYFPRYFLFFFKDPPPTEIYTLPLHDALPICFSRMSSGSFPCRHVVAQPNTCRNHDRSPSTVRARTGARCSSGTGSPRWLMAPAERASLSASQDRKSTRLNSSHDQISYAVFCF